MEVKITTTTKPGIWVFVTFWMLLANLSEVSTQQQSFRKRPQPIEVKLGDTAVLQCEIENQAGQAQWTKDGFALGFSREIPGFTRYSMAGDGERGVHNLRIVNVTLQDIAEYQCQVGPARANKAIRSDAHLNVIVAPKSIEMINHAPDALITLKEKDQTELECVVREARPAASIIWFKNGKVLRMETREDMTEELEVFENNVRVKKNTTRSKIRFVPSMEDDRTNYTCEARHPALSQPSPMKVTVFLSVQYSPGAPRIEGYREGDLIRENDSVTLTCVSRGGNPLAELIWFRNDVRIDSTYATQGRESRNELKFVASTRDNLARYRCEATNIMSVRPKLADVTLTVFFAPQEVKITGPTEAKIGDTVTFTCVTTPSNPRADIAWFRGGQTLEAAHTTFHHSSLDGGYTSSSNVSFKIESTDRSILVTCQGINRDLSQSKGASHMIDVIQPPGQPRIYRGSANITEGQLHRLMCTSTGGHPKPELTFYRGSRKLQSTVKVDGNTVTAELNLSANMTDNSVVYRCEAKSKAISTPLSDTTTFQVWFHSSNLSIKTEGTQKEGERLNITCETGFSNPPATVTWWRDNVMIPAPTNQSRETKYNGRRVSSTLELDLTSEFDGAVYRCQAMNAAIDRSEHYDIKLQVQYKPKFTESMGEKITVVEGESKILQVKAKGNPEKITYKWTKNGSPVKGSIAKGAVLNITSATTEDKGRYEVTATNDVGSSILAVDLDVQHPAKITTESKWITVGPGEAAHLSCQIDANPLEQSMVQWTYAGAPVTNPRADFKFRDKKSYLNIVTVTNEDQGTYTCNVDNGIGQPTNASIFLVVKHKPDIDKSPQIAKAASAIGDEARLICRAKGSPNVTFQWKSTNPQLGSFTITQDYKPSKYSIRNTMVDVVTWESMLIVQNVEIKDYGQYSCAATNTMGDDSHIITLNVSSIPETPMGLRVQNFTHDSVTLSWTPRFNGGFQQAFRIMYWKVGSDYYQYADVSPRNATVFTVQPLALGTDYSFSILAFNPMGNSNYSDTVRQETSKVDPDPYTTRTDEDFRTNPVSRVLIIIFVIVGATMLILNVILIACFLKRRSKKRMTAVYPTDRELQLSQMLSGRPDLPKIIIISVSILGTFLLILNIVVVSYFIYKKKTGAKTKQEEASEQGSSKSATIEMYAPSSYNETVTGETLSSISEKSATYSHGEPHDEYNVDENALKEGVSTYLVEQINHHSSSSYPYREMGNLRASTLPRQPKLLHPLDPHGHHHEDDGYVDALRRNVYNNQVGDPLSTYGRTTPRPLTRPPQVPPIPELYNIPPEARYVPCPPPGFGNRGMGNGSIRNLSHSASQSMLNSSLLSNGPTSFQPNGRLVAVNNGPLSPNRTSILTTFVPNPSPNNIEHEGHLV